MKTTMSILFAAAVAVSSLPAHAAKLDLSTMSCKQFLESGDDTIKLVLTWMDGWYKGDEDNAIIDTDVFVDNAKKFGTYCGANPSVSIVTAADEVLGKSPVGPGWSLRQAALTLSRGRRPSRPNHAQPGSIAKALDTIATGLLSVADSSVTRPKLMVRPSRTTLASASTSEDETARMKCVV